MFNENCIWIGWILWVAETAPKVHRIFFLTVFTNRHMKITLCVVCQSLALTRKWENPLRAQRTNILICLAIGMQNVKHACVALFLLQCLLNVTNGEIFDALRLNAHTIVCICVFDAYVSSICSITVDMRIDTNKRVFDGLNGIGLGTVVSLWLYGLRSYFEIEKRTLLLPSYWADPAGFLSFFWCA